jgi:hypothetical protein
MTIFDDAKKILNKEIESYQKMFDIANTDKVSKTSESYNNDKDKFDNELISGINDFNIEYTIKVSDLKKHIDDKKKELDELNSRNLLELMKYKDEKTSSTMNNLLKMIYAIRVQLDGDDDFVESPHLEGTADINKKIVKLQHFLMGNSTMDEDLQFMAQVYTAVVKSPPTSLNFNDLYPKMLGLVAKVNDQSVAFKTYQYTTSPDFEGSISAFSNTPSMTQSITWDVITKAFQTFDSNTRFANKHVTRDYDEIDIMFYVLLHVMNKYKYSMPYTPANPLINNQIFNFNLSSSKLDNVLVNCPSYFTHNGIKLLFTRSFPALLVNYDSSSNKFICDLSNLDNMPILHDNYHKYGGIVTFDDDMNLETIELNNEVVYSSNSEDDPSHEIVFKQIVASALCVGTWGIHFGVQHKIVADEWNYQFANAVYKKNNSHLLVALIKPLTLAVSSTNNTGHMILVSKLDTCISSIISNINAKYIVEMGNYYSVENDILNSDKISEVADWTKIKSRLNNIDTPLVKSFDAWWNIIQSFVSDYVNIYYSDDNQVISDQLVNMWLTNIGMNVSLDGLKSTISMMYFNQINHEVFSNSQLVHDLMNNKLFYCVTKDQVDGVPASVVHLQAIQTMLATDGGTVRFLSHPFEDLVSDDNQAAKDAFVKFRDDIKKLAENFDSNPADYLPLVHPSNIECSIAW